MEKDKNYEHLGKVNKEIKRGSKVIGAFFNEEALLRLSVSILININEKWIIGHRSFYRRVRTYQRYRGIYSKMGTLSFYKAK